MLKIASISSICQLVKQPPCSCSRIVVQYIPRNMHTVFVFLHCCGYTLTDFPISIRLTSLALGQSLGQSNDCPSASKATLVNMDKYFMWIHYERLHNHNKAKHNKTVYTHSHWPLLGKGGNLWESPLLTEIIPWISNDIHVKHCDAITHPCLYFNCDLTAV